MNVPAQKGAQHLRRFDRSQTKKGATYPATLQRKKRGANIRGQKKAGASRRLDPGGANHKDRAKAITVHTMVRRGPKPAS